VWWLPCRLHPFLFLVQLTIRKRKICLHRKIGAREVERVFVILRHDEERSYLASAVGQINRRCLAELIRKKSDCAASRVKQIQGRPDSGVAVIESPVMNQPALASLPGAAW
jgi:hypothetical protein